MLWACVVRSVLSRDEALEVFREVALIARKFIDSEAALSEIIPTHSNLAARYPELIPRIIQVVGKYPLGYAVPASGARYRHYLPPFRACERLARRAGRDRDWAGRQHRASPDARTRLAAPRGSALPRVPYRLLRPNRREGRAASLRLP
jgi:hypothetical protein